MSSNEGTWPGITLSCWACGEPVSDWEYFTAQDGVTWIIHDWCLADARKQDERERG